MLGIQFYLSAPAAYLGISYSPWLALALLVVTSLGSFTLAVESGFIKSEVASFKNVFLEVQITELRRKLPRCESSGDSFIDLE